MFAVSRNGCAGSAGLGLCVCLELSISVKKHRPGHKAALRCSQDETQCFSQLVEQGECFS